MARRLWTWFYPSDPADRRQFLVLLVWIELAAGTIGVIALLESWRRHWIGGLTLLLALPVLLIALGLGARLLWSVITRGAQGVAQTVLGAGNLTPAESTSAEDALVARGRVAEAVASFERRIRETPRSATLRLALATLYQRSGDRENAVRSLLEVRAMGGAEQTETLVSNALIDLYEAIGDRAKLVAEYARFADRHRGTSAARAAKRRLAELKAELHAAPEE